MRESSSSTDHVPDDQVTVGTIGKPHGLRGEFYVFPETDHPERFAVSSQVFVDGEQMHLLPAPLLGIALCAWSFLEWRRQRYWTPRLIHIVAVLAGGPPRRPRAFSPFFAEPRWCPIWCSPC